MIVAPSTQILRARYLLAASAMLAILAPVFLAQKTEPPTFPAFTNIAGQAYVDFICDPGKTSQKYLPETMTGGVAMLDYDGDGFLDLFFVNGAALQDPMPKGAAPDKSDPRYWNRLFHNNGDGTFTDVTAKSGLRGRYYGQGVAVGDYNNDGRPDLYITNFGQNILYRNMGDGTFRDETQRAGVAGSGWSTGAVFLDYDRDGLLDLFVTRYLEWNFESNRYCGAPEPGLRAYCHPENFQPVSGLLFHNNGDGTFTDATQKSGLSKALGKGLGVDINDYDRDGWPDIFVANDSVAGQLFHNNHDGTFTEAGLLAGVSFDEDGHAFSGMGVSFGDYDNDGWPDLFVNALANQKYALFHNVRGAFEYVSGPTGVSKITSTHSGWGAGLADFDNDGWKDLFVAQSHVLDNVERSLPSQRYREPMLMLRNRNGTSFEDVSARSGPAFQIPLAARGAAFGDLNNDGFIDIAVQSLQENPLILRNDGGTGNHWLTVSPEGTLSNRDGIGAVIRLVTASGPDQYVMVKTSGSYLSASDKRVHFGLGRNESVKLCEIQWPSGVLQRIENPKVDRILRVRESAKR